MGVSGIQPTCPESVCTFHQVRPSTSGEGATGATGVAAPGNGTPRLKPPVCDPAVPAAGAAGAGTAPLSNTWSAVPLVTSTTLCWSSPGATRSVTLSTATL